MKWLGSFIIACIGLMTAFCYIWRDAPAAFFNYLTASVGASSRSGPVPFTIYDELGPNQLREVASVHIDATLIGQFQLNPQNNRGEITGIVPRAGRYRYHVQARTLEHPMKRYVTCFGSGLIHITAGACYYLRLLERNEKTG
jgi:hypothetical protein